ncbi:MAG: histone deacetylase [Gemmatimonadetes bacterium]|jgi:acetoin utilization deacetylase AcuC-like enzyme|nr:histone deacetylase [Gemmatimonadota bacterium]MBT7861932.1 histone deacetylase [Gemmatimonadota bacterium]
MSSTRLYYHPAFLNHEAGPWHPERPDRVEHAWRHLQQTGLAERLSIQQPSPASPDSIRTTHSQRLIDDVQMTSQRGGQTMVDADTVIMSATWEAALLASGGVLQATDAIMADGGNAFCMHRPPGHHAEHDQAMGFCFFNHIAIAAHHLLSHHGLDRVAIVDWDVHHGNGTQHTFEEDPRVHFFSIHQSPHFPGTGAAAETGVGEGLGRTQNVPLTPGHGDVDYMHVLRQRLRPALEEFQPQFILVSAGFDAHQADPLGDMRVTTQGFRQITDEVVALAGQLCEGRFISVLEGGYDLPSTTASIAAHLEGLLAAHA